MTRKISKGPGKQSRKGRIEAFGFREGQILNDKYEVLSFLGSGWEGEVYLIKERRSGIERAAKCFFPQRNPANKTAIRYARKLHLLRDCPFVIQYASDEQFEYDGITVTMLLSEYVEGEILSSFIARQRGGRLSPFQALHLLYALVTGIEPIHHLGEYHGDLHAENVIVRRYGLGFDLKVLDFIHHDSPKRENMQDDICKLVHIFYESLGGQKHYAKQPREIKEICCGLKRGIVLKKFPRVSALRAHLESMRWS